MELQTRTHLASDKMDTGILEITDGQKVIKLANNVFQEIKKTINKVLLGINKSNNIIKESNNNSQRVSINVKNISRIAEESSNNAKEVASSSQD
ncbi:MAG: hypothetical protein FH762_17830 [Firmicutes bacterium]|nr:hypothetical protein [Bacillota bacterium]